MELGAALIQANEWCLLLVRYPPPFSHQKALIYPTGDPRSEEILSRLDGNEQERDPKSFKNDELVIHHSSCDSRIEQLARRVVKRDWFPEKPKNHGKGSDIEMGWNKYDFSFLHVLLAPFLSFIDCRWKIKKSAGLNGIMWFALINTFINRWFLFHLFGLSCYYLQTLQVAESRVNAD